MLDLVIIAGVHIEHYEIAARGAAVTPAEAFGENDVVKLLTETLEATQWSFSLLLDHQRPQSEIIFRGRCGLEAALPFDHFTKAAARDLETFLTVRARIPD